MKGWWIFFILGVVVALVADRYIGSRNGGGAVKRDTVVVERVRIDTVVQYEVKWRTKEVIKVDSVFCVVGGDTVYVEVPISEYKFTDDSTYTAVVDGYDVRMRSMETYPRTVERDVVVTNTVTRKPAVVFTAAVGVGATVDKSGLSLGPTVMVGVGVPIFTIYRKEKK